MYYKITSVKIIKNTRDYIILEFVSHPPRWLAFFGFKPVKQILTTNKQLL